MANLDHYRMRVKYKGLKGLSGAGFMRQKTSLGDLFPTADEILLSTRGYFRKLGESASIIYEVSDMRFDVVDSDRVLELAMPNPRGDYIGVIVDVLAFDFPGAKMMIDDIEETCEIVRARFSEAIQMMEMSEEDYLQRLRDSMNLLANELHG